MSDNEVRLAAANHHPAYPPPALIDGMYLDEVEHTRQEAEEIYELLQDEGGDVPAAFVELLLRDIPAMTREIRHLREILGWER